MKNEMSPVNCARLTELGLAICALRRYRGLSQAQLAERAGVSKALISAIEAPGSAKSFSLETFYNIADALGVEPEKLLGAPEQFESLFHPET